MSFADVTCPADLYVMDADGSNVQRLTSDPAPEWGPVWSPDGTRIAFVKTLNGTSTAIFTMSPDGGDVRQVSSATHGSDFSPTWSFDGSQLAFASIRDESWGIWIVNAEEPTSIRSWVGPVERVPPTPMIPSGHRTGL